MKLITDLEDLRFKSFIKAQVNKDLSVLIVEGKPTPQDLQAAWNELISQYHELVGNTDVVAYLKRMARIEAYSAKVLHVEAICLGIEQVTDLPHVIEMLVKLLNIWGYSRQFTPESTQSDLKYIRNCNGNDRLKLKKIQIEQDEYEQKEAKKAQKQGKSDPKKDFMSLLHAIESHKKMVFDRDKLNMYDFAMYVNELKEYSKETAIKLRTNGKQ